MQTQIDPETVQAIDRQVTAFTNRYGKRFPALAKDIRQEAWATCLETAHRYDPQHPGARGFFYLCAHRHVLKKITKWRCLVSLSNEAARHGIKAVEECGIDSDRDIAWVDNNPTLVAPEPDPETIAIQRAKLRTLRTRWRCTVEAATSGLTAEEQRIGALAHGLDGEPRSTAWVARTTGIWRDEVEQMIRTYRKAMRRPGVVRMEREIAALEEILS